MFGGMFVTDDSWYGNNKIKFITRTAILLALTLVVQWLRLPTIFTGPLVNFMLIISTALLGSGGEHWSASLPPLDCASGGDSSCAFSTGHTVHHAWQYCYCLLFGIGFRYIKWGGWVGLIAGSLLKFVIIAGGPPVICWPFHCPLRRHSSFRNWSMPLSEVPSLFFVLFTSCTGLKKMKLIVGENILWNLVWSKDLNPGGL